MSISFHASREDGQAVTRIAERFRAMQRAAGAEPEPQINLEMDLLATNANGCPLDFPKMEAASDGDLAHDIYGIGRHLDRNDASPTAGKLLNHFRPRCAKRGV